MSRKEWAASLCIHHPQNPDGCSCTEAGLTCPGRTEGCACDNCFTGRDKLAQALLRRPEPACDRGVLQNLRAELHKQAGGQQREVQADVARLTTVTARWLYHLVQRQAIEIQRLKRQPWLRGFK